MGARCRYLPLWNVCICCCSGLRLSHGCSLGHALGQPRGVAECCCGVHAQVCKDDAVVVDGQCVTSQGPGTAMAFGLKLVEMAVGAAKAEEIAKALLYMP